MFAAPAAARRALIVDTWLEAAPRIRTINAASSALLVIDFQSRLMPSIEEGVALLGGVRMDRHR